MRTSLSNVHYSIREAAGVLGVAPSNVARAIRLGQVRTVRRRGQVAIPASALIRLLGDPMSGGTP